MTITLIITINRIYTHFSVMRKLKTTSLSIMLHIHQIRPNFGIHNKIGLELVDSFIKTCLSD